MRAVRFDQYGGTEVLEVREVDDPTPQPGRAIVRIKAAGINPGENIIRLGLLEDRWPTTFPSGEGSDLSGEVVSIDGEGFAPGDEVLGWTDERGSHAELVSVPVEHLVAKPAELSWEVAGSLFVAGMAGLSGVQAVGVQAGDTVVVSAAAGGVGLTSAQLAKAAGATVLGLAGEGNHAWLTSRGIVPVLYGDGQEERVREASAGRVDALIDTFGGGYVDLGISLGVTPERINTVIDFEAAAKHPGVQLKGTGDNASANSLGELVAAIVGGDVEWPVAGTFPLDQVAQAYDQLAERHTRGKLVLIP